MRKSLRIGITLSAALTAAILPGTALAGPATVGGVERVSLSSSGAQGNSYSGNAVLSADARIVAFSSAASNLVPGDTNNATDVFVRDRQTGAVERITGAAGSVASLGENALSISRDGRYVAFTTEGAMTPDDTDNQTDVYLKDRQTGALERVSRTADRGFSPTISANGRYVTFITSDKPPQSSGVIRNVHLYDRQTGATDRITTPLGGGPAGRDASPAAVTPDGRFVAFASNAKNLVAGDTDEATNIFLRDRQTGVTEYVDVSSTGQLGNAFNWDLYSPAISDDGRYVGFHAYSSNLVPGDTNNASDVFLRDRQTGTTKRLNVAHNGGQSMPTQDPFGYPDQGDGVSVSADGRYVTYVLDAEDLIPGDTNNISDVFQYDQQTGTTKRLNRTWSGAQISGYSGVGLDSPQAVTPDGAHFAYDTRDSGIVQGDTNDNDDVFVMTRP